MGGVGRCVAAHPEGAIKTTFLECGCLLFGKILDALESFKVTILCPNQGAKFLCGCIDNAIGQWKLMLDTIVCRTDC